MMDRLSSGSVQSYFYLFEGLGINSHFRGDDGNVGIIRSPVRAIVLLDRPVTLAAR
jgi:hypothetical protein